MRLVKYFPIISSILFEFATVGQIIRMFREHSALGQELISWIIVSIGLALYAIWYKVITPDQKIPFYSVVLSVFINIIAAFTVAYFRYWR